MYFPHDEQKSSAVHVAVQDGWSAAGQRYMVTIPFSMSTECRYDKSLTDKRSAGCQHAGSGKAYDQMIRSKGK